MIRAVIPLVIGAVAGALAMWLAGGNDPARPAGGAGRAVLDTVAELAGGRDRAAAADTVSVSDRLAVYRSVVAENDLARLQRDLEAAAARSPSLVRDLEIEAILARLAALAPAFAIDTVLALGLEQRFVVEAYVLLAEADADAAVAALDRVAAPRTRQEVALALIETLGNSAAARERVARALAPSESDALIAASLAQLAAYDPFGALRAAQGIADELLKSMTLSGIATAWAREDPESALLQADSLPADLASRFRSAVYSAWARLDSNGYAAHLESLSSPPDEISSSLQLLAASDPERALGIAERIPGMRGEAIQGSVWSEIAARDPAAAMAHLNGLPTGQLRDRIAMSVASGLASRDPDAALEWAEDLDPPVPNAVLSVVSSIAQTDPLRALELMDRPSMTTDASLILSLVTSRVTQNPAMARELANELRSRDDMQSNSALQGVVANWMQSDPEAALDWVLANDTEINANVLSSAALTMVRSDPLAAAAFVDRLPERHRSAWVTQVAGQFARYDPDAALAWVGRFQGREYYPVALREILTGAAQTNPRAAAQALSRAPPEVQLGASQQVARLWAGTEPRAAADWALNLSDQRTRENALASVVGVLARTDPDRAEALLEQEISDPQLRRQAERLLEQARQIGPENAPAASGVFF